MDRHWLVEARSSGGQARLQLRCKSTAEEPKELEVSVEVLTHRLTWAWHVCINIVVHR